jgi:hypothetical protein
VPGSAPAPRQEARLSGWVVGPDGHGIGAAIVTLHPRPRGVLPAIRGPALRSYRAAPDGSFHFEGLAVGRYLAVARAEGFTVGYRDDLEVEAGDDLAEVRIQLWAGGVTLKGRVLDAGGGVVPGARVRATSYALNAEGTHDARAFQADVDEEGRYRLQVPPGTHKVSAVADGYAPITESDELYRDQTKDFLLQPAARISGRVVTAEDRTPVAGVKVSVRRETSPDLSGDSTTTDDGGVFVVTPLSPGAYVVTARMKGLFGELPRSVVLGATDAVDDLELVVAATFAVRGRVTSAAGRAVAGASVNLSVLDRPVYAGGNAARGLTDDEGRYEMDGLPARSYRLVVSADGYATSVEPVSLSSDVARDVVLGDTAVVTGVVLTASGQPAVRAQVRGSMGKPAAGRDRAYRTTTDAEGHFSLKGLGGGDLFVTARDGGQVGVSGPEPLGYGERKQVTIRLGPGASVVGAVSSEDGAPPPATLIVIVSTFADGGQFKMEPFPPFRDGTFVARGIPPGEISVRAIPLGRHAEEPGADQANLTLKAGEERAGLELVVKR